VSISRKTCPVCGQSVITLIADFKDGKIVGRFCHRSLGDRDSARNIEEVANPSTLAEYTLEERLADLSA